MTPRDTPCPDCDGAGCTHCDDDGAVPGPDEDFDDWMREQMEGTANE